MDGEFSSVSTPDLVAEITTLAGHLNAANARFLALIAELDRRRGWAEWGVKSCAHWLNWKCGIDLGAAREKVRVAHALEKLPRHRGGTMAEGRISYFKVASHDPRGRCDATRTICSTSRSAVRRVMWRISVRGYRTGAGCCGAVARSDPAARPVAVVPHRAGWLDGDSRPGSRRNRRAFQAGPRGCRGQPSDSGKRSGRKRFRIAKCSTVPQAPGRSIGHDRRELPGLRPAGALRRRPPADRGARGFRDAEAQSCRPLRARTRAFDRRRDREKACLATPASSVLSRTRRASRSTSVERPGQFRPRSGGP